jgi:lipopolysaccharide export LptBFGC system permease protein LptF
MPRWAKALMLVAALLLGLLLIILAAGVALIVIPVAIVSAMVVRWRYRNRAAEAVRQGGMRHASPQHGNIIEGEYRVIDRER